jgi:hypothetical protein
VQKVWGDSSILLDGAIPGVFGGIAAGFILGLVAALTTTDATAAPEEVIGPVGEAVRRVIMGVAAGLTAGLLVGALIAAAARYLRSGQPLTQRWAAFWSGAFSGAVVTGLVDVWGWSVWGAGIGAAAGTLWPLFCRWADSSLDPAHFHDLSKESFDDEELGETAHPRYNLAVDPSQVWHGNQAAPDSDEFRSRPPARWPEDKIDARRRRSGRRDQPPSRGNRAKPRSGEM